MISARVRIPDDLTGLLQGEWEQIIAQAGYSEQDAEIVRRYVMDKTPQIDVAVELDMARSTITRRLPQIYARARHTAAKLPSTALTGRSSTPTSPKRSSWIRMPEGRRRRWRGIIMGLC